MSSEMIALVVTVGLVGLLLIRIPVAIALAMAGTFGVWWLIDGNVATSVLGSTPYSATAVYTLVVVPLFISMGIFARNAGLAEGVFAFLNRKLRRFPAGVPIATIVACAMFGAISGSSIAAIATLGPIAITEMDKAGYDRRVATGVVASAGTLGILIPPSIPLVLYGIVTGQSIRVLLIAGLVPGILTATVYSVTVSRIVRLWPGEARPVVAGGAGDTSPPSLEQGPSRNVIEGSPGLEDPSDRPEPSRRHEYRSFLQISVVAVIVIGGLYAGVFTVTESAGVGSLLALLMLWSRTPSIGLRKAWNDFLDAVKETVSVTSMVMFLFIGASIFTYFLLTSNAPSSLVKGISSLSLAPFVVVILLLGAMVLLGTFLESFSIILIVVPLAHAIVADGFGFDGIWFAILALKTIEIGLVTPPVGMNCYVLAGLVPGLRVETVFRSIGPFILADMVVVTLLLTFPPLVTWLPSALAG